MSMEDKKNIKFATTITISEVGICYKQLALSWTKQDKESTIDHLLADSEGLCRSRAGCAFTTTRRLRYRLQFI